jgi:hypothetical protein
MQITLTNRMIFDKHTWVCSLCGQGLTRKSTANRHNNNLHLGGAMIVRPYEYIVGRLNGKFLQGDPSLYRGSKGGQKDLSSSIYQDHGSGDNYRMKFGAVQDNIGQKGEYGNVSRQPAKSNDVKRTFYAQSEPHLQPSHEPVDVKAPDTVEKFSGRILTLKQIEMLAYKHCPPQIAKQIIIMAGMQVNLGDDDSLDKNLAFLRNIDEVKSY